MLYHNNKEITNILHLTEAILSIYHMDTIVWQAIRSCFGNGFWSNDMPWNNEDAWNNG